MEDGLIFGIQKWGEYGAIRYQATLAAGEKRRITLNVPRGRWWVVFRYRFGDITADVINFRFDNVRNYFEQDILIGAELLNHTTWPKPFIVVSGVEGAIVVWNTDDEERAFSIVLDFYVIDNEVQGRIREMILGSREEEKGRISKQAGTGGA